MRGASSSITGRPAFPFHTAMSISLARDGFKILSSPDARGVRCVGCTWPRRAVTCPMEAGVGIFATLPFTSSTPHRAMPHNAVIKQKTTIVDRAACLARSSKFTSHTPSPPPSPTRRHTHDPRLPTRPKPRCPRRSRHPRSPCPRPRHRHCCLFRPPASQYCVSKLSKQKDMGGWHTTRRLLLRWPSLSGLFCSSSRSYIESGRTASRGAVTMPNSQHIPHLPLVP